MAPIQEWASFLRPWCGSESTVGFGIVLFGESAALSSLAYLGLIVTGVLGLKFLGK